MVCRVFNARSKGFTRSLQRWEYSPSRRAGDIEGPMLPCSRPTTRPVTGEERRWAVACADGFATGRNR